MKITVDASETAELEKIIYYCDLYSNKYKELENNQIQIVGDDLELIKTSINYFKLGKIQTDSPNSSQGEKKDLSELKLTSLNNIKVVNFPNNINTGIASTDKNTKVIMYFIDKLEDIESFVSLCSKTLLPKDNTCILIYRKGRFDVNLDSIFQPFKENVHAGFMLKDSGTNNSFR